MTRAELCRATHPLTRAHSATAAAGGRVYYVVCGFGGCPQRRVVRVDEWQAELDRRAREGPAREAPHDGFYRRPVTEAIVRDGEARL